MRLGVDKLSLLRWLSVRLWERVAEDQDSFTRRPRSLTLRYAVAGPHGVNAHSKSAPLPALHLQPDPAESLFTHATRLAQQAAVSLPGAASTPPTPLLSDRLELRWLGLTATHFEPLAAAGASIARFLRPQVLDRGSISSSCDGDGSISSSDRHAAADGPGPAVATNTCVKSREQKATGTRAVAQGLRAWLSRDPAGSADAASARQQLAALPDCRSPPGGSAGGHGVSELMQRSTFASATHVDEASPEADPVPAAEAEHAPVSCREMATPSEAMLTQMWRCPQCGFEVCQKKSAG